MKEENKKRIWDQSATSFHKVSLFSKPHRSKYTEVAKFIISKSLERVIDLGCGSGILEKELIDNGFNGSIFAIDISDNMLKIAREFTKNEEILFKRMDIDQIDNLNKDEFDCAVSINTIYLLRNKKSLIIKLNRAIQKGGYFILINPKPKGSIFRFIKENLKGLNFSEMIYLFFKGILNISSLLKIILLQNKIESMTRNNELSCPTLNENIDLLEDCNFSIENVKDIQANQNWLIIARKK